MQGFKVLTLKGHLFPGIGNVIEYLTKGLRSLHMIDFKGIDKWTIYLKLS